MNSRITSIADNEVVIRRNVMISEATTRISCGPSGMFITTLGVEIFDDDGVNALIDCLNCHRDTQSFAALADTSNVAFCGKRLRDDEGDELTTIRLDKHGLWHCIDKDGFFGHYKAEALLPLTPPAPKPKYRPMTPVEAAAHLGRSLCDDLHNTYTLLSLDKCAVQLDKVWRSGCSTRVGYMLLVEKAAWASTGLPCGTLVPEGEA